jgi:hypothetical protein
VCLSISFLIGVKHLEPLITKDGIPLEIFKRTKDEEVNKKAFKDIINVIKGAGVYLLLVSLIRRKRLEYSRKTSFKANL